MVGSFTSDVIIAVLTLWRLVLLRQCAALASWGLFHAIRKEALNAGSEIICVISSCFSSDAQRERLVYQDIKQKHTDKGD